MQVVAGKGNNAAGRRLYDRAEMVADVADQVVGLGVLAVRDDVAPGASRLVIEDRDGAVLLVDRIERAPAGQVGLVVGISNVAGILVP